MAAKLKWAGGGGTHALPLRAGGASEKDIKKNVTELLSWVGLGAKMDARPPTLSGGEQQRVAIARAIVNQPDVLIADEPTGNLDTKTADDVFELMRQVCRNSKTTFLFVTHNMTFARRCDRVIELVDGCIVADASEVLPNTPEG